MKNTKINNFLLSLIHLKENKIIRNKYKQISDWNFPILSELKNNKPISYVKTIHIQHYASIIGTMLNVNSDLIKTGSEYSCILSVFDNDKERLYYLISDLDFPVELNNLIKEINDEQIPFTTIESFVVSLCKTFVFALLKLKSTKKNIDSLYEPLINSVMNVYYNSDRLKQLNLSFKEFEDIKQCLIEEKKYLKMIKN